MEDKPLRKCKQCGTTASNEDELEFFKTDPASKYGRRNICNDCFRFNFYKNQGRLAPPKRKKMFNSKRDKRLFHTFGIRESEYQDMLVKQNHKCKICGAKGESDRNGTRYNNLAVDHCHDTGTVRGLLCMKCNIGLGNFQDNIIYLENAINYLKER